MSEHQDSRSAEQIQSDIQQTRTDMSETLDAIRNKFSPGEILDQALTYFKTSNSGNRAGVGETASEWASSLGDMVKQNPVPVALIGAGVAWLMMGGSRRTTSPGPRTSLYEPRTHIYDTYDAPVSRRQGEPEHSGGVKERAGEIASGVQERMSAAGERVGDMAASAWEGVGHTAERLRHQARQQGGKTKEAFNYLRDEQPLVLGALGFALGAALGAGLPPTQREDELMGETRDQVVHRAQELGEEQLERAKHVAATAGAAALEQANQEGMTQGRADQAMRQATEKMERVANAAVDAGKKEADQQEHAAASTHTSPRT